MLVAVQPPHVTSRIEPQLYGQRMDKGDRCSHSYNCSDRTSLALYHMSHGTKPVMIVAVQSPCIACRMNKGKTKNRCSCSSVVHRVTLVTASE
jgi:hypothetical protein